MSFSKTYDGDEPMRVNKWLGQTGVCSRREAETLIKRGLIVIDGQTLTAPGHKILPGETLTLKLDAQESLQSKLTLVVNKPVGYVSSQPERDQIPAARLITAANLHGPSSAIPHHKTVFAPLGRLDKDSRGLLLLSEDGVLAKAIIGPASPLDKEYLVKLRGNITPAIIEKLRFGLKLDGRQLKRAQVTRENKDTLRFVLQEGRNRQIRRMCERVNLDVVDLYRIRIGPLAIDDLPEGMWRPLNTSEREKLIQESQH